MSNASAESIVRGSVQLGSLPEVFGRINEAVSDPNTSISSLAHIVADDPGLASRLLKISNSGFYSFPRKVDTVSQAVMLLGTEQVRDLALATSVIQLFAGISDDLVDMKSFWTHSIGCAMCARALATACRQRNVERFFVAGVLHDIGRLIMFEALPEESQKILEEGKGAKIDLHIIENTEIGFDHSEVARILLEKWHLPVSLVEAVGLHHHPRRARQYPLETSIVHVADVMTHSMQLGTSGQDGVPALDTAAWERTGLSPDVISTTWEQVSCEVHELVGVLTATD